MRKAGVTAVGAGFFYKQGFDYAQRFPTIRRSRSVGFDVALDAYEEKHQADVEGLIGELTSSVEIFDQAYEPPDEDSECDADANAEDDELDDVGGDDHDGVDGDDDDADRGDDDPGEEDPGESDDGDGDSE